MLTKKLSPSAANAANKPEWHKTAFRTSVIQIWSCLVKVLKPVPAVAECKPLYFLKQQETQPSRCTAGTNTHGEDFLRLPTRSHVGVVNLFEDHPGFVVLPHLTGGDRAAETGRERQKRERERWRAFVWSETIWLWDSNSLTFEIVDTPYNMPLIFSFNGSIINIAAVTHFTSKDNYPGAVDL